MSEGIRDFNSPEYKAWRAAVRKRDNHRCRLCGGKVHLQVHHIKQWVLYPELRFVVSNGITLCKKCHERIRFNEKKFEELFTQMVGTTNLELQLLMMKYGIPGNP